MGEMRTITIEVPTELLDHAQEETGRGVDETIRAGLRRLAARRAQRLLLGLKGSVAFDLDLSGLRDDET